jgi:hypothetical protein
LHSDGDGGRLSPGEENSNKGKDPSDTDSMDCLNKTGDMPDGKEYILIRNKCEEG